MSGLDQWPSSQAPPAIDGGLRSLFMADQELLAQLGYMQPSDSGAPELPAALSNFGAAGAAQDARAPIGWGGQMIPDSAGFRIPWFGKRGKLPRQRPLPGRPGDTYSNRGDGASSSSSASGQGPYMQHGGRHSLDQQQLQHRGLGGGGEDALSVEEAVTLVRRLGRHEPLPERLFRALHRFDRCVAVLWLLVLASATCGVPRNMHVQSAAFIGIGISQL